jgi:uncharacterized protein (TIGR03437 family)
MVEPAVTIEGVRATVLFAGLTPSFVGLLQINVQLPAVLPAGDGLELVARFGNVSSPRVRLAVE